MRTSGVRMAARYTKTRGLTNRVERDLLSGRRHHRDALSVVICAAIASSRASSSRCRVSSVEGFRDEQHRPPRIEDRLFDVIERVESLLVRRGLQFAASDEFLSQMIHHDHAVFDEDVRVALDETIELVVRCREKRTTTSATTSRVAAPIIPPVTELSSPMIAFCTVFDNVSRTTRSNGLSCASSRLPASLRPTIRKNVNKHRPQHFFRDRQRQHEHVRQHLCVVMRSC